MKTILALLLLVLLIPTSVHAQVVAQGAPADTSDANAWPIKVVFADGQIDPRLVTIQNSTLAVTQSGTWTFRLFDQSGNGINSTANALHVNVQNASLAVTGTFWQATQPVSGTFWQATQPVSGTFWQATQPISAAALPLPTGASTAAKQPAFGTAGSASADVITVQGAASMTPVAISAASLPLPAGAATEATLATAQSQIELIYNATLDGNAAIYQIVNGMGLNGDPAPTYSMQAGGKVTTAAPTYVDGDQEPLSLTTAGGLRVSAATLPLPAGAATAALQTQPGVDIGDVTVNNAGGAAAVNIQDGGNIITVNVDDGALDSVNTVGTILSGTIDQVNTVAQVEIVNAVTQIDNPVTVIPKQGSSTGILAGLSETVTLSGATPSQFWTSVTFFCTGNLDGVITFEVSGNASTWKPAVIYIQTSGGSFGALALTTPTYNSGSVALAGSWQYVRANVTSWGGGTSTCTLVGLVGPSGVSPSDVWASDIRTAVQLIDNAIGLSGSTAPTSAIEIGGRVNSTATAYTYSNDSMAPPSLTTNGFVRVELPDEGQQTMANSVSVAIASDQVAVPIESQMANNPAVIPVYVFRAPPVLSQQQLGNGLQYAAAMAAYCRMALCAPVTGGGRLPR